MPTVNEMVFMAKKKKKKKTPVEDMDQYDDTHYWTKNKKK